MLQVHKYFVKEEVFQSELVKRLVVSQEVSEPFLSEDTLEPPSGSPKHISIKHINIDQSRMMVMVDNKLASLEATLVRNYHSLTHRGRV